MTKSKWSEKRVDSDDYFAKKIIKTLILQKTNTVTFKITDPVSFIF